MRVKMRNFPHHSKSSRYTQIMYAVRFARPPPTELCVVACGREPPPHA